MQKALQGQAGAGVGEPGWRPSCTCNRTSGMVRAAGTGCPDHILAHQGQPWAPVAGRGRTFPTALSGGRSAAPRLLEDVEGCLVEGPQAGEE